MIVKDQREALCMACEMERRAIGIYQRALTLTDKPEVRAGIQEILKDEREHLRRFSQVREQYCGITDAEERLLIAAMGAEALFPGGVMEMRRANSLDSLKNLYTFARDSEADAVRAYGEFADKCEHPAAREAFLAIAREEGTHLTALEDRLNGPDPLKRWKSPLLPGKIIHNSGDRMWKTSLFLCKNREKPREK